MHLVVALWEVVPVVIVIVVRSIVLLETAVHNCECLSNILVHISHGSSIG